MPAETHAWSLFGDGNSKKDPSVLQSSDINTEATQAINAPTVPVRDTKNSPADHTIKQEDTSKRTAFSSTYINQDGTHTLRQSSIQRNFEQDGVWKQIDNKLTAYNTKVAKPKSLSDS